MSRFSVLSRVLVALLLASLLATFPPQQPVSNPTPSSFLSPLRGLAGDARGTTIFAPEAEALQSAWLFRTLNAATAMLFGNSEIVFPLTCASVSGGLLKGIVGAQDETRVPADAIRLRFLGASPDARIEGQERLPGVVHYYAGNDPTKWEINVPTYGRLVYAGLYPGIDLIYDGSGSALKGTFVVAPGADPSVIRWRYEAASDVKLQGGVLSIYANSAAGPVLVERAPVAWQGAGAEQTPVAARYVLQADGTISFAVGSYDRTRPLIIDPTVEYSTYWGSRACDGTYDVAVDASGKVYFTGTTNLRAYPAPSTPNCGTESKYDLYVTKLDPSQSGAAQHIYTTYAIGSDLEIGVAIGLDSAGNVYVGGYTRSGDFPTTPNAFQRTYRTDDAAVVKLDAAGVVQYATYLGGSGFEELFQLYVTPNGLAHVVGFTTSNNFPTTVGAFQRTLKQYDAWVSVVDASKSGTDSLVYSTLFGGSSGDEGYAVAGSGDFVYLAGTTRSSDLPLRNPIYTTYRGAGGAGYGDVYVAKLDRSKTGDAQLVFSTYLGGTSDEIPGGLEVGDAGQLYMAGITFSSNFPVTAISPAFGGGPADAFVAKVDTTAPALIYSRFLGGNGRDGLRDIVVDRFGNAYAAGGTGSSNLPTVNPIQATFKGGTATDVWWVNWWGASDTLIAKFDPTGATGFASYWGGTGADGAGGIALGANGKVYVVGGTKSTDLTTLNPYQATNAGAYDAFVLAIGGLAPPAPRRYFPVIMKQAAR